MILAALTVGTLNLISPRLRGAVTPPEADPDASRPRAAPSESTPPATLGGEDKP